MAGLVSFPMYDFPSSFATWQEFYQDWARALEAEGIKMPSLTRGKGAFDLQGDVFLSQTCGAPFRNGLSDHLYLIATPDFGIVSGLPGFYRSYLYGAPAQGRKTRLAVNGFDSQSGFHAVVPLLHKLKLDFEIVVSGSHANSLHFVKMGEADLAGVDALSQRFILRENPELADLPLWGESQATPGLPFVTSHEELVAPLRSSLQTLLALGEGKALRKFGLKGAVVIEESAYLGVQNATI